MKADSTDGITAALEFRLLDQRVRIEAGDPAFLRGLAICYEEVFPQPSPPRFAEADLRVRVDRPGGEADKEGRTLTLATDPPGVLRVEKISASCGAVQLATELNQWAVENTSRHYVFHAGAVVRDGRAILLPGGPSSGKTTVSAGLAQRGFDLLSDEVGAIEVESGRVVGYPRALSIRPDVLSVLGMDTSAGWSPRGSSERMVGVRELPGSRALDGGRPALIVIPRFRESQPTRLERLRPGAAVLSLMDSSCSQRRFKVAGLDFVIDLALCLPCYRLMFSNLETALEEIETAFRAACRETP